MSAVWCSGSECCFYDDHDRNVDFIDLSVLFSVVKTTFFFCLFFFVNFVDFFVLCCLPFHS